MRKTLLFLAVLFLSAPMVQAQMPPSGILRAVPSFITLPSGVPFATTTLVWSSNTTFACIQGPVSFCGFGSGSRIVNVYPGSSQFVLFNNDIGSNLGFLYATNVIVNHKHYRYVKTIWIELDKVKPEKSDFEGNDRSI